MNATRVYLLRANLRQTPVAVNLLKTRMLSQNVEEKIEIPKRIPRGPTDILRALESTVSRDPTASHFKYHDDPYLIPMSNIGKRTCAMAQEAGRKAAHWVKREHADLFQHKEAEPLIEAFLPKFVFNEQSNVTEKDLENVIENLQVSDAMLVYNLLKTKGVEVSPQLKQSLLELLCYFNSEDTLSEEFIEERWFKQSSHSKERARKTWRDGSFAEEIFISIETPTAEAYSAIIRGMAKHYQVERAWQLFEESQQKGLVLNTDAYNSLIKVASYLKESYEMRWHFAMDMLSDLNKAQLKPNLGTLNAVLYTLSTMGGGKLVREYSLKSIKEFSKLGVEPSLGSWYYVMIIFCKERGTTSTILNDIMRHVENKQHKIQDLVDTNFFVTAMDICRHHLRDVELANRVDALLHYGNNYDFIGDSYKESIYYRNYFNLFCNNLPIEEFMLTVYNKLVPHIYVPEPSVMEEVLRQVEIHGATEYLPQLWSDMVVFDHARRENLVEFILDIMVNNKPPAESELHAKFSCIAWDIYTKIESQPERRFNKLSFTGELLGKIMMLVLQNNEFDKACTVMDKLDKGHSNILGVPRFEALSLFVDHCIEQKVPSRAIACIQYCSDSGFPESGSLAARLNNKLTLDGGHLNSLSKIVGNVALDVKADE